MGRGASAATEIRAPVTGEFSELITPGAIDFLARLASQFRDRHLDVLERRKQRQADIDRGSFPDFLPETRYVRDADWRIEPVPADIQDRRVEITGPTDRKMVINALNSGASVYMADFEDANCPTWSNLLDGQINLRDAVRGSVSFENPDGRQYRLNEQTAVLFVRPRGWHLWERHFLVDGKPVPGAIFDFGLYFYHNAVALRERGKYPYFYLPKLESHQEARLWNDIFVVAQDELGVPRGTIKATVLIETVLAAFEMDEILYELRDHSAGLNCGRWDYIFSFIKKFRNYPEFDLPDRGQLTMDKGFLAAYVDLLIKTCHRRGAHAMGGMAAQIPIRTDPEANAVALEKVRADKLREVQAGHDGTWVAHPGLVQIAKEVFDAGMAGPNQIDRRRDDVNVTAADMLRPIEGAVTAGGLQANVGIGLQYLEAWLRGIGCVPINNLMEDAATCEISRAQVWQWRRHGVTLEDGRRVTADMVEEVMEAELGKMRSALDQEYGQRRFDEAAHILKGLMTGDDFVDFLTIPAYEYITREGSLQ